MQQTIESRRKKSRFLFVVIPLIAFIAGFLTFSFFSKTFIFAEEQRTNITNYTYPMEEIIVNLKDGSHFLKIRIALGYNLPDDKKDITKNEVQARDAVLTILRNKSAEDLMSPRAEEDLKDEIQNKLNQFFPEKIVTDIFLMDFLIQ
ncbi:MAG TPA: hypothetical protein GX505_02570 [Clostridiales bacterium]|nr:hypothetical protein [Clostridiales bacterium]